MNLSNLKIVKFFKTKSSKYMIIDIVFFLILVSSITLKGILFQGFATNKNPYSFNFWAGFEAANPFLKYYLAFSVLFLSFFFIFKSIGKIIFLLAIDMIITFLILIDVWYFRGFQTVPSLLLLTQTANLENMSGSISSMFSLLDILFLLDFLVLAIYIYITKKYNNQSKRSFIAFLITFLISILFIGYVPFNIHILNNKDIKNSYLFSNYDPTNTARYFSPIGYHIFDAYTVYRDSKPYKLTDGDKADIKELFETKKEDLPNNKYYGMAKNKNLIYIQVESLENFVIGKKINGKEITPNLNKLVQNSLYFPNTFEQVNEGTSADADLMVNTSMLPLRRGCTFFRYPGANYNSMPKILQKNGYNTSVIHPDKGSFWNYQSALTQGIKFQKFTDSYSFNLDETIGMGISDKSYFEQVVPMLKELKQPFYGMTVTLTSHGPFDLPKEYRKLGLDSELDKNELGGYFESLHYTDAQIGNFISELDKEGILQNSIIAIMGDHTGVHKYYDSSINSLSNKEDWFLNTGNPTVPFIIYDPSSMDNKTFDSMYNGEIDVMPTLLYLLGIPKDHYENSCLGRNLLNTNKSFAVLTNGTIKGGENLTDKETEIYKKSLDISDKMIRANYFNN